MIILLLDLLLVIGSGIAAHKSSVFERHFCLILCLFISSMWVGLSDLSAYIKWHDFDFVLTESWRPTITRAMIAFGVWYSVINSKHNSGNRNVFRAIDGKQ